MAYTVDNGGWQLVGRGGRGRPRTRGWDFRPQNQGRNWSWNRGGMGPGGKARAIPGPQWGGRANPPPNQPAPPFRASTFPQPRPPVPSRYWGPQSRSYADVVRQTNPRQMDRNWNNGFGRNPSRDRQQGGYSWPARNQRPTPTDPKFGKLVRQLKKVIKIVHHLQNVTGDNGRPQPQMISRMVEVLATMIKPAAPNNRTMDMIAGNAKNWGHTTLMILQDHYEAVLDDALKDLTQDPSVDWKAAFEVATRWTRRNLPRLPRDVVDHAQALVTAVMVSGPQGPQTTGLQGPQTTQTSPQTPQIAQTSPQNPQTTQTTSPQDPQTTSLQDLQTKQTTTTNPQTEEEQIEEIPLSTRRRRREQEDPSQVQFLEEVVIPHPPNTNQQQGGQQMRRPNTKDGSSQVEPQQTGKEKQTQTMGSLQLTRPVTSRPTTQDTRDEEVQVDTAVPVPYQPPKEQRVPRKAQVQPPMDEQNQPQMDKTPSLTPLKTMVVEAQVLRDPTPEDSNVLGEDDLGEEVLADLETSLTPPPQSPNFGPTRHIRTDRKLVDWTLSVSKKWLMIGDSNLSRLPHHGITHLQIDSFPGANFRHLGAVLSKAVVQVLVEKVLISCGLNSRGQKFKETTVKQLQTALRMAKRRFPYAEIWIPLVNYSTDLPEREQRNLIQLNAHLYKNMPYLHQLPDSKFQTEQDNVHWTRETGKAMLDHWCTILNLQAP